MHRTRRGLVALAVAVAVGAPACGDDGDGDGDGGDQLRAREWAREACRIQFDFETAVTAAVTEEQAAIAGAGTDLEAQKQALVVLLDTAAVESDEATERIDALGAPDAPEGDEALEVATDRFVAVRAILDEAIAQAEALPVTDPTAFAVAADAIGTSIGAGFQELAASLPNVGTSEELTEALTAECGGG